MAEPIEVRAMIEFQARLRTIAPGAGYRTDIGDRVVDGPYFPESDQCPQCQVSDGGDQIVERATPGNPHSPDRLGYVINVDLYALVERQGSLTIGRMRADCKKAVMTPGNHKLVDEIGTIGKVRYDGSEPIASKSGVVVGSRLNFTVTVEEYAGNG